MTDFERSQAPASTSDVTTMMAYDANKKSVGVSYLIWFFLGMFGVHRFYLSTPVAGILILLFSILGFLTLFTGVGAVFLLISGIWCLLDAFLIPGIVRRYNNNLVTKLSGRPSV